MSRERTDAELLSEAGRDPTAFGELYERHVAAVHDWHVRRIPWAAADLTAEQKKTIREYFYEDFVVFGYEF